MEVRKEKNVMNKERGGHLYKNSTMAAVLKEKGRKEVGRGGHLYKNGAVPVEVRKEKVEEPRAGPTTVALATSPGGSRLAVPPWVRPPISATAEIPGAGTRLGASSLSCHHTLIENFGKLDMNDFMCFYASPPSGACTFCSWCRPWRPSPCGC